MVGIDVRYTYSLILHSRTNLATHMSSRTHTHTHTRACARARTHSRTSACKHSLCALTCACTYTDTHAHLPCCMRLLITHITCMLLRSFSDLLRVKRHPALVRLTGRHPFNCEPPLPARKAAGFITPPPLHYVRNNGAVPVK